MAQLKIVRGREIGRILGLGDESFFGREDTNTFRLLDETCSRHHAKIVRLDDAYVVVDLGSNNGTFVNGEKVRERFLKNGDQIQIGKTLLAFEGPADAPQAVTVDLRENETTQWSVESSVSVESPKDDLPRLKQLYEIAALCNAAREPHAILGGLASTLLDTLEADTAVAILEGGESAVRVRGKNDGEVEISRTAIDRARVQRKALLLSAESLGDRRSVTTEDIRSILCAPLVRGERWIGSLYVDFRRRDRRFTGDDLEFLNTAAHLAASALDRAVETSERAEPKTMVGADPAWMEVLRVAEKAGPTDSTVLLLGESGTGKELVARALHERSARRDGPFVAINCGAIVETLVESELFGHEKGSFTGATRMRRGKFESARGGTLFLDEIGDISPSLQVKLLRVLQERTFYRVGGTAPISADVRIVAATNRDLDLAIKESRFREDLYYRLSVVKLRIPPLRERKGDIPPLCCHFLERMRQKTKKRIEEIEPEAMDAMMRYPWPGNVRELENVIERAVILAEGASIGLGLLPPEVRSGTVLEDGWPIRIEDAEKVCVQRALARTGGKKGEAAKLLGISWPTLNKKLKDYGLES